MGLLGSTFSAMGVGKAYLEGLLRTSTEIIGETILLVVLLLLVSAGAMGWLTERVMWGIFTGILFIYAFQVGSNYGGYFHGRTKPFVKALFLGRLTTIAIMGVGLIWLANAAYYTPAWSRHIKGTFMDALVLFRHNYPVFLMILGCSAAGPFLVAKLKIKAIIEQQQKAQKKALDDQIGARPNQ